MTTGISIKQAAQMAANEAKASAPDEAPKPVQRCSLVPPLKSGPINASPSATSGDAAASISQAPDVMK